MEEYVLSSESNMDLDPKFVDELGVSIIYANYELNGEVYVDDFGQSLDMHQFYKNMEQGARPTTSRINTQEYISYFKKILDQGKDIIHICLSSGMSGQYSSLLDACDILKEDYPDRKIYPIDSRMASAGIGLLVSKLASLKKSGMDIDSLYNWAMENRLHVINYTSNNNLEYVARGGRISKTAASIGGILHICPLIEVNDDGEMVVTSKIRTERKLVDFVIKHTLENAYDGSLYDDEFFISTSENLELTEQFVDELEDKFPNIRGKIRVFNIGPTIGSHIGPGTVALFYWGNDRMITKK